MKSNQASWERILRIIVGILLIAGGYKLAADSSFLQIILMSIGGIALITGVIAYCPAWHLLGISTKPDRR